MAKVKTSQINSLFDELCGKKDKSTSDELDGTHVAAFAKRINIHPDDVRIYLILWRLGCSKPGVITRSEWTEGFGKMGVDTVARLIEILPALRREIRTQPQRFREFYDFVFEWSREDPNHKTIIAEDAVALWRMVLPAGDDKSSSWPLLDKWLQFIEQRYAQKPIKRDLWRMTLDFSRTDLAKYDPSAHWPSAIDEFFAWRSAEQQQQGG